MAKGKRKAASLPSQNHRLWLLKYEVDDERFQQIFGDFADLIRRSERACEKAAKQGNPEYAEAVSDTESDYLEELIGASFLVLQAKIRRVDKAAEHLVTFMKEQHGLTVKGLDHQSIFALGGKYRKSGHSRIELIWAIGNYYKHRDEWDAEVWKSRPAIAQGHDPHRQSRRTRQTVEKAGIVQLSTGNMRRAYEFLGIKQYSKCEKLAEKVQAWAKEVYEHAKKECSRAQTGY
ncbi:hypothetical protein [Bradyrhizobium sp. HKCCYLRH1062]|uniref:hypothetical protein n=1 Tax=unclassified Bradyrhizobium TaxID=2631580 RepID=UPI003EB8A5A6